MRRSWTSLLLTLAVIGCAIVRMPSPTLAGKPSPPPPPPIVYSLTVLNGIGNGPYGLNDYGDVVGVVGNNVGVIWPAGSTDPIDLNTLVDPAIELPPLHIAYAINNSGQIAGSANPAYRLSFPEDGPAVFFSPGGLGPARDINEAGDLVIGLFYTHVYTDETGLIEIENPFLANGEVHGRAINNFGAVVGDLLAGNGLNHAFLYSIDDATLVDLNPSGSRNSWAGGINDAGDVVGNYLPQSSTESRACIWSSSGFVSLGTLGGNYSVAFEINNDGLVVGRSTAYKPGRRDPPAPSVAFLYVNSKMYKLLAEVANGGLIANGQLPTGWGQLPSNAVRINDADQICGWVEYPDGTRQGFRLTPMAP